MRFNNTPNLDMPEMSTDTRVALDIDDGVQDQILWSRQYDGQTLAVNIENTLSLEEQLAAALEDAARSRFAMDEAKRAKMEFIANISHEIRTPLNAIVGFSDILAEELIGSLNTKQHQYLKDIRSNCWRLNELLINILDMAQMESSEVQLNLNRFTVRSIVVPSVASFRHDAKKHQIRLSYELAADAEILICADQAKLKKALCQLISNAIKFTPDQGNVLISARVVASSDNEESRQLEIDVCDDGIGITPDSQARLFNAFSQLESPFTKRYSGAGLGLTLAKKLLELQGGTIRIASNPDRGSTFTIIMPLKDHRPQEDQT